MLKKNNFLKVEPMLSFCVLVGGGHFLLTFLQEFNILLVIQMQDTVQRGITLEGKKNR